MEESTEFDNPLKDGIDLLNQRVMKVRTEDAKAVVL